MDRCKSISNNRMKFFIVLLLFGNAWASSPLRTSIPDSLSSETLKAEKRISVESQQAPWIFRNKHIGNGIEDLVPDNGLSSSSFGKLLQSDPERRLLVGNSHKARKLKSSKNNSSKSAKSTSYRGKGYWFGYGGGYGKGIGKGFPAKGKGKGCVPLINKGKGQVFGNAFVAKGKGYLPDYIYCNKPNPPSPTPPSPTPPSPTPPSPGEPTSPPTRSPFQTPPVAPSPPTPPVFVPTTQAPTPQDQTAAPTQYPERPRSGTLCEDTAQCNAGVPIEEPPFVCEQEIPCLSADGLGICLTSGNPRISLVWEGRSGKSDQTHTTNK